MIKTKEVIKELGKMNLQTEIRINNLFVVHSGREDIASVNLNTRFEINTSYWAFKNLLSEDEREKVYVLLTKLAETDPQDREEEKKYYLRHKWIGRKSPSGDYLNYCDHYDEYQMYSKEDGNLYTPQFTLSEIDEIKERFNTDLSDFEMIEVVD